MYYATGQQQPAAAIATAIGVKPTQVLPVTTSTPVTGVTGTDVVVVIGQDLALTATTTTASPAPHLVRLRVPAWTTWPALLAPAPLPCLWRPTRRGARRSSTSTGRSRASWEDPRVARSLPGVPEPVGRPGAPPRVGGGDLGRPTVFLVYALGRPPGLTLALRYGLERALHGREHYVWAAVIDAGRCRGDCRRRRQAVYVEPKGLTVTLHWRQALEQEGWVVAFAERQRVACGLMVHQGRHERELRPPLARRQGHGGALPRPAHDEAAGRGGGPQSLRHMAAFGDDVGDLPAFVALGELGAAGRRCTRRGARRRG